MPLFQSVCPHRRPSLRILRPPQVSQDDETGMPIMTTRDGKEKSTKGKYFQIKCVRNIQGEESHRPSAVCRRHLCLATLQAFLNDTLRPPVEGKLPVGSIIPGSAVGPAHVRVVTSTGATRGSRRRRRSTSPP